MSKAKTGGIGTASHPIKIYSTSRRKGNKAPKTKYTCAHYDHATRLCQVLNIECVGCSNAICPGFSLKKEVNPKSSNTPKENDLVCCPINGIGMILHVYSENCYEVKFKGNNRVRKLNRREIDAIRIKELYD